MISIGFLFEALADNSSDKVKCQKCGKLVDYTHECEIAMGAVKCPHCGVIINQDGEYYD